MSDLKTNLQKILQEKQDKIIPENIKKDVQIFDVTGTYEGSGSTIGGEVKLFETEEEMQADENPQDGDLAIVYREEIQNMTVDTQTQYITFPETVTLPEAFTGDAFCMLRAVDETAMFEGQVMLNQSMFDFNGYTNTDIIRVSYISSDGITYNRDEFMGDSGDLTNPVDLGTIIHCEMPEEWNDNMGYFMQIGGNVFNGLYTYTIGITLDNYINFVNIVDTTIVMNETHSSIMEQTWNGNYDDKSYNLDILKTILNTNGISNDGYIFKDNESNFIFIPYVRSQIRGAILYDDNLQPIGIPVYSNHGDITVYKIDFENESVQILTVDLSVSTYTQTEYLAIIPSTYMFRLAIEETRYLTHDTDLYYAIDMSGRNSYSSWNVDLNIDYFSKVNKYILAQTQLSATSDYVYEKEFYGKNGVETGTLTQDISNSFADTNAEIVYKIQNQYENMEPRVLTDDDKTIDKNMYFIPVKKDGTPLLDTSSVTDMEDMFNGCTNLTEIPLLDTSSVTSMHRMLYGCTNLTTIPLLNTSKVSNMVYMFYGCTNLTEIPLLDTSSVITMGYMFSGCTNLTTIPLIDTSSVTIMFYMFYLCTKLTTIPLLNTTKVVSMDSMFYGCTNLTTIPLLNTSSVTNMGYMFYHCTNLTEIPLLDTSSVTSMHRMFNGCTNLTTIPLLDTSKVSNMREMFTNCTSLSDESLNNILAMCVNAIKVTSSSSKTLKSIGLTSEQATKCTTLSNYSTFTAAGWTTGY